jgi:AcrR family transcriptional regulator
MLPDWTQIHMYILQLEAEGVVSRTFRRLDPERQQAILFAILDEAYEKGPASINIKEVARRAGVSVGSLYTYFPDREGMLAFAVEVCVRLITAGFGELGPYLAGLSLREALTVYLAGGVEWSQAYWRLLQLFARGAYQGDPQLLERLVRPIATVMSDTVRDVLAAAAARGEIRPDVDLEAAARLVNALTIAVGDSQLIPYLNTYFQVIDDDMPPERVMEALLALVVRGLGPA